MVLNDEEYQVAQSKLDNAIQEFVGDVDSAGLVTTYVLVAHVVSWDSEGNQLQEYPVVGKGGAQPVYASLGLLDLAQLRMSELATERNYDSGDGE